MQRYLYNVTVQSPHCSRTAGGSLCRSMLSLWGKLTKPSATSEEADEKYYFTSTSGHIVSVDGSGYVIPAISEDVVEKADYVPLDFAQKKINTIAEESNRLREAYQKHLQELDAFYRQSSAETKEHYETLIKDLKAKALRHVEIRKQMQQQSEDRLNKELKQSEESVEELRDNMASLNREYQEEVRALKHNVAESAKFAEGMAAEIATLQKNANQLEKKMEARHKEQVNTRLACTDALNSIMHKVEIRNMQADLRRLQATRKDVSDLQVTVLELERKNKQQQAELEQADRDRAEAADMQLQSAREIESLHAQHAAALEELAATHAAQAQEAKRVFEGKLRQLRDRLDRAEVANALTDTVGHLVEEHSVEMMQSLSNVHSTSMLAHNRQEEDLVNRYEGQMGDQRRQFEEESKALKKKYGMKLQVASDRLRKSEVQLCLKDLVLAVVERVGALQAAAAVPVVSKSVKFAAVEQPASPRPERQPSPRKESPRPAGAASADPAEHAALLAKVQELEDQIAQQRQEFEGELARIQSSKASPRGPAGDATPAVGAAAPAGLTPEQSAQTAELAQLRAQEASLLGQQKQAAAELQPAAGELDRLNEEKEACKNDIKEWSRAFLEANGREPNVQDKATVKDKYQKYKTLSARVKDQETKVESLKNADAETVPKLAAVRKRIAQLVAALAPPAAGVAAGAVAAGAASAPGVVMVPQAPPKDLRDAEMQTEDARSALRRGNTQKALDHAAETEKLSGDARRIAELEQALDAEGLTVEQLDDQLYQLKQEYERVVAEKEKNEVERAFLATQVDTLVKEKRTDVVKRYEEDIERLKETHSVLNEKIATLTAEKVKNEARIKELLGRVDMAEAELKERDSKDVQGLDVKDEKVLLKGQISKQREQIILKAKAATAGWDAAAHSDERLDVEVERAFKKGFAEERQQHIEEMKALNAAIEVKEVRVTELLVAMAEMERKVMQSDLAVAEMTKATEAMKLEVADTIASLSQMALSGAPSAGEDGEEPTLGPTQSELDNARDQLDVAQEELVGLMERCDRLEQELEVARRKNRVYQDLAALTGLNNADIAMKKTKANTAANSGGSGAVQSRSATSKGGGAVTYDVNEVVAIVKKAITKGQNLWKSNRKDECYDVYLEACQDCFDRLLTAEAKAPLGDAIASGKNFGVQNKQRGAVPLKKALDKLAADFEKPGGRQAEDDAAAALRGQAAEAQVAQEEEDNDQVAELVSELDQIEATFLEQGYTKDRNPSNSSSAGTVQASPRAGAGGAGEAPASLLARAKSAEAQVVALKKQLAAVVAATARSAGDGSAPAAGSGAAAPAAGAAALGAGALRRAAAGGAAGGAGGADPAEVRKLNRKIKDLETQIKNGAGAAGGGGGGGAEIKALQQNEKVLQKKLKDAETNAKRDAKSIEMRAVKAENALSKIEATYNTVVAERDKLRGENAKLSGLPAELAALRAKTEYFEQVEVQLDAKNKQYDVLAEQFKKETTLRKKYKNELEDLKGAIRVYARCRPMAKYEIEKGCKSVVEIKDETSMKVVTSRGDKDFEFDAVFSDQSTQDQVFEDTKRLVESCMDGFNVCLFAYGQTGSGKTFTMTGSPSMPGLTPKAIDELFRLVDERAHLNVKVTTYFVELYNDNLVDLYWVLDNKGKSNAEPPKLDIKMDAKKMVYIRNAVIKDAASPAELMELFNMGNLERHTGATKMNAESSRSHSIFAIMVECEDTATKRTTTGKLSLVDLAGSERADKTGAAAERLKEAQSINKSLSALGDVIAALSENNKFVPYRNNKLTQLMQDSLGGNAKTLMFVNFSPADYNSDETSTSLMYAARVKKIVNNASKQAESEEVARLKLVIKRLQAGLPVELPGVAEEEEAQEPPPAEDNKVYDGY